MSKSVKKEQTNGCSKKSIDKNNKRSNRLRKERKKKRKKIKEEGERVRALTLSRFGRGLEGRGKVFRINSSDKLCPRRRLNVVFLSHSRSKSQK